MSYARKRSEGQSPEDIYAEIRKKNTEEALITGERWIITVKGIPDRKVTTEFAKETVEWLYENGTEYELDKIRFTNILNGEDISVKEMRDRR